MFFFQKRFFFVDLDYFQHMYIFFQLATASVGVAGALAAMALDGMGGGGGGGGGDSVAESAAAWIVPFTCGGFLNISLVKKKFFLFIIFLFFLAAPVKIYI